MAVKDENKTSLKQIAPMEDKPMSTLPESSRLHVQSSSFMQTFLWNSASQFSSLMSIRCSYKLPERCCIFMFLIKGFKTQWKALESESCIALFLKYALWSLKMSECKVFWNVIKYINLLRVYQIYQSFKYIKCYQIHQSMEYNHTIIILPGFLSLLLKCIGVV